MLLPTAVTETNQLIDQLPVAESRSLRAMSEQLELEFGRELAVAGEPVLQALFPLTAIVSMTARVDGHTPLEMGMIGHEGMLGATLSLGVDHHPMRAIVQGAGTALVISAHDFRQQLKHSPVLERVIHRYLFVLNQQLSQTAACNAFHEVSPRLARWLLMMTDRARGEPLVLTHLFLSDMLGVRRSAVTIAAGQMQDKQLIRYSRGHIQVMSRAGLEAIACNCYQSDLEIYQRQFSRHEH